MFRFLIIAPFSVNANVNDVTVADEFGAEMEMMPRSEQEIVLDTEDAPEPVSKLEEEVPEVPEENTVFEDEKKTSSDGETSAGEDHQSNAVPKVADTEVSVEEKDVSIQQHKQEEKSVLNEFEEGAVKEIKDIAEKVENAMGLGEKEDETAGKKEDEIASSGATMAVNLFAFVSFILVLC